MPTKRVRLSDRRRCVKACGNCKRRKERCDGQQPCRRCVIRRVEADCVFAGPGPLTAYPAENSSTSSSSLSSIRTPNSFLPPAGSPPSRHLFHPYASTASFHGSVVSPGHHHEHQHQHVQEHEHERRPSSSSHGCHVSPGTAVPQLSRLIGDGRGRFMFIGDAANLAFLKVIRRLVRDRIGSCLFTDDPLRHVMVEATPEGRPRWIVTDPADIPPKPGADEARYLLRWYLRATNCILETFDEAGLLADLEKWLRGDATSLDEDAANCIFYLVLGIGAQRCPDDRDAAAERYFNYGRFLAVVFAMENPTYNTVRSYVLVTVYLLGASRRNSAFMHLGVAVRAAYALGIHRRDDAESLFAAPEQDARDRLWKALRVLDLFLGASLGRPLATLETRDTSPAAAAASAASAAGGGGYSAAASAAAGGGGGYSASLDLCHIFESILTDVYARRMVTPDTLERISEQLRRWAARFADGLSADGMKPGSHIAGDDGERYPNIALYHMKEAYYWSIMLLSRPFLIDHVSRLVARSQAATGRSCGDEPPVSSPSERLLVHACVDSAMRTVDLLSGLVTDTNVSKRHPFIINSVFVSAMVLGLAVFGDLDATFPLGKNLEVAQALLRKFSQYDRVASRDLAIVEYLRGACALYAESRAQKKMECQGALVGELFGSVHEGAHRTSSSSSSSDAARFGSTSGGSHRDVRSFVPRLHSMSDAGDGSSLDQSVSAVAGSVDGQHVGGGEAGRGQNAAQALTPSTDILMSLSPRTLLFDSYSHDMPFFPTMDASMAHMGYAEEMLMSDTGAMLEPPC
ncbi:Filamentous growth regulator 27 [Colletotrichum orbiculare MAFF 240422]|uniref:Filamentous growth regulator 27 n=1 Tax=Colletotrichum orbiculare (strain 104-T / ATCC 96160 / CBS 514.97 / LARS 414 / MAFF 240422) TaxID=1213857 RepID=A0A484FKY1_COLOR|nr:Filamentous growth regulator 27 [Colletotrichum orbiculare MAFF 240422]